MAWLWLSLAEAETENPHFGMYSIKFRIIQPTLQIHILISFTWVPQLIYFIVLNFNVFSMVCEWFYIISGAKWLMTHIFFHSLSERFVSKNYFWFSLGSFRNSIVIVVRMASKKSSFRCKRRRWILWSCLPNRKYIQ